MTTPPPDWAANMDLSVSQALLQFDPALTLPEVKAELSRRLIRIWEAGNRYERATLMEMYPESASV